MIQVEKIDKGMFNLWRGDNWYEYTHSYTKKRGTKFFLMNPNGTFRVRVNAEVVFEGNDLDEAIKAYNQL